MTGLIRASRSALGGGGGRWLDVDTTAPVHHTFRMRLTVNLEPDLYALAVSLAKAEDCSISVAVNRLLRRSLADEARPGARPRRRNDFLVSKGREPVTADTVARTEAGDDVA